MDSRFEPGACWRWWLVLARECVWCAICMMQQSFHSIGFEARDIYTFVTASPTLLSSIKLILTIPGLHRVGAPLWSWFSTVTWS